MSDVAADLSIKEQAAKTRLDAQVREIVEWHFNPETGCPFWLDFAAKLGWDPRREISCFEDLRKFPPFQDEWLRGGPVRRWLPKGLDGKPLFTFETGGTTGVPKSRLQIEDFRTDYEIFSETLPDEYFPRGANWLMLGPSGPRRLRLAVEHLCQHRGGICFCVDLDPRWVIKLIKWGEFAALEKYKAHVIEQAVTLLGAGHDIRCMFTTPKLLEALAEELEKRDATIKAMGITGIFAEDGYKITYYAPQPRAVIEVVAIEDPDVVVDYGETGRVRLTTLTRETFIPGFLERDEGERERPCDKYPWDGVSGVRPFRRLAAQTTVGVY
jgi:hypothetical protein